jgi:hypothetical protein
MKLTPPEGAVVWLPARDKAAEPRQTNAIDTLFVPFSVAGVNPSCPKTLGNQAG